ncbi:MAG: dTMP kinase [Candidatus Margulisiibacteriota bacterium]
MFITFEGIEGSGKSTQRQLLMEYLTDSKIPFVVTREPGGTEFGTHMREVLLSKDSRITTNRSELFLFAADRTEHINQVIQPALNEGKWVVCDRYIDSTFAYQYGGRQHPRQDILDIIRLTDALEPDLTFFLDVSVEEGLRRARQRGVLDRFEQETFDFHQRVRAAYLECASLNPHRIVSIMAEGLESAAIFESIKQEIKHRSVL